MLPGALRSQATESGPIGVYADIYHGRATASGVPYDRMEMTAAHATLPFGTWVRVANFETGRMVDVKINDRKKVDGRPLIVSRAAADRIGLAPNKVAPGSMLVIASPVPATVAVPPLPVSSAPDPAAAAVPAGGDRRFRPLAGLFGKDAETATSGVPVPLQAGIPGDRGAPSAPTSRAKSPGGGLFGQKTLPPAPAYPSPFPSAVPQGQAAELLAMNALNGRASVPGPVLTPPSSSQAAGAPAAWVSLPPASPSAPYRVQFGAFRRVASADELSGMLRGAGIPTSVFGAPGSGLNVVVTDGGFRSAEEAQRWIDFEGSRRGWIERPVVIR